MSKIGGNINVKGTADKCLDGNETRLLKLKENKSLLAENLAELCLFIVWKAELENNKHC